MQEIKLDLYQYHSTSNYYIHPSYYLSDVYLHEKIHLTIKIPFLSVKNNYPKCKECFNYFLKFWKENFQKIQKLTIQFYEYEKAVSMMANSEIIELIKGVENIKIKFKQIDLNNVRTILNKLFKILQCVKKCCLSISECKTLVNDKLISFLTNTSYMISIKYFKLIIHKPQWQQVQLFHFFQRDCKNFPKNLENLALKFSKLLLQDKMMISCFQNLSDAMSPSLKSFQLMLNYSQGNEIMSYLSESLIKSKNLEILKLNFTQKPLYDDIINCLDTVFKNLNKIKQIHLLFNHCFLQLLQVNSILNAVKNLKSLEKIQIDLQKQFFIIKTEQQRELFQQFQDSIKEILENNADLQSISINTQQFACKTNHDIYYEYQPIQFTQFFPYKYFPNLSQLKFQECEYSGKSNEVVSYELFQHDKNKQLLNFLELHPQLIELQISNLYVNENFLITFSETLSKMDHLIYLDIQFRQANQHKKYEQPLFSKNLKLEKIRLVMIDFLFYIGLIQNKTVKEAIIGQNYTQIILKNEHLFSLKAQKITFISQVKIPQINLPSNFQEEEFPKIMRFQSGGNELIQLIPCLVIENRHDYEFLKQQRVSVIYSIAFYKIFQPELIYSPQQILYDLFDK